ncbi:DUF559 domain-containing protein [Phenylobacterium sp. LjRoot219]|uniref:DUF559 domain-containing protein n=1 Tax=Phenylobacterium sp. LjRoot219 TaxID=3342283 RepID=UPI003F503AE1
MTTTRARDLRKSKTPQERRLWSRLRTLREQGYHFRRQAILTGKGSARRGLSLPMKGREAESKTPGDAPGVFVEVAEKRDPT